MAVPPSVKGSVSSLVGAGSTFTTTSVEPSASPTLAASSANETTGSSSSVTATMTAPMTPAYPPPVAAWRSVAVSSRMSAS